MQKWEYKVVSMSHDYAIAEAQLNELGEDGWELVASIEYAFYLKRRKS